MGLEWRESFNIAAEDNYKFFFFFFFFLRILNIFNTRTHGERGEGLKKTDSGIYSKSLTLGYRAQTRGTLTCVGECIH